MKKTTVGAACLMAICSVMSAKDLPIITKITISTITNNPVNQTIYVEATPVPNIANYFEYSSDMLKWTRISTGFVVEQDGGIMAMYMTVPKSLSRLFFRVAVP